MPSQWTRLFRPVGALGPQPDEARACFASLLNPSQGGRVELQSPEPMSSVEPRGGPAMKPHTLILRNQ
eukprot:3774133-Alexandrium_andersonii.AAC.1